MKSMQIVNTFLLSIFLSGTFTSVVVAQHNAGSGNLQSVTNRNAAENPDSFQTKANIHTSRSNIKRGMKNPQDSIRLKAQDHNSTRSNKTASVHFGGNNSDSLLNKANIHTSRSSIKRGMQSNPADSVQKAGGHNSTRSNVQRNY